MLLNKTLEKFGELISNLCLFRSSSCEVQSGGHPCFEGLYPRTLLVSNPFREIAECIRTGIHLDRLSNFISVLNHQFELGFLKSHL